MEHINCRVDTQPMANEIHTVSKHLTSTSTAVVAMQAAVIKADQEAADQVCSDVNRGFHTLMSSQLSQKIAKLQSEVDSHLMRLAQQTKQLQNIRNQIERDYMRTAQRYSKIFNSLNKELRHRIQELDQPIFRFVTTEIETTHNRMSSLTATIPIGQIESVTDAQRILTSNIKNHSVKVLESTSSFVNSLETQKELTNRILLSNQKSESKALYIPVIISENKHEQGISSHINSSNTLLNKQNLASIQSEMIQTIQNMPWQDSERNELVDNELTRLIIESESSERVKKMIQQLATKNSKYKSL
jgi:hypothetical protein